MAFLTDASYLKSLEDYMMENNHLKDSPVEKHVEDDRNKKNKPSKKVTFAPCERDRIQPQRIFFRSPPFDFFIKLFYERP